MGVDGVEELSSNEADDARMAFGLDPVKDRPERPTDQEIEDKRQAELQEEREEHNRRAAPKNP